MAFVDTKMAEMRSARSILTPTEAIESQYDDDDLAAQDELEADDIDAGSTKPDHTTPTAMRLKPSGRQPRRPRRPPPKRDEGHTARDSLVDQIMAEVTVPHYALPVARMRRLPTTGDDVDNDEAAMEAFKNQFLADSERNKKRKSAAPPTGTKGVVPTSHGPKLGGSRAQRARMKAAEAAAAEKGETLSKK